MIWLSDKLHKINDFENGMCMLCVHIKYADLIV